VHWDITAIMDFASWARQQLGAEWEIVAESPLAGQLPSVNGLFRLNGFEQTPPEQGEDLASQKTE
jgi:hypothetical protein